MTKETSTFIKGVAILFVLIGHFVPPFLPFNEIYVPVKRYISQVGVDLFMFVSGYGVCINYLYRYCPAGVYFKRRFLKLWPLYAFAIVLYSLLQKFLFGFDVNFEQVVAHLFGVQVYFSLHDTIYSASHFISAIFTAYILVVPALFFKSIKNKIFIVGCGFLAFGIITNILLGKALFIDYFILFSFGIFAASYEQENGIKIYQFFLLFNAVFLLGEPSKFLRVVGTVVVITIVLRTSPKLRVNMNPAKFFVILGFYSYPIYLSHNYFVWRWPEILAYTGGVLSTGIVIIITTFLWCSMFVLFDKQFGRIIEPYLPLRKSLVIE